MHTVYKLGMHSTELRRHIYHTKIIFYDRFSPYKSQMTLFIIYNKRYTFPKSIHT